MYKKQVNWKRGEVDGNGNEIKKPNDRLNMLGLLASAIVAFFLYRIVSSILIFKYTKSYRRLLTQFFDLDLLYSIYVSHLLEFNEVSNIQRFIKKLEAIFERYVPCTKSITSDSHAYTKVA